MHKLFKKFGSLALVICTVVALAALPVSAREDGVGYALNPPNLTDANGNTFNPGFDFEGDSAMFESLRACGAIWMSNTHTLSLQPVKVLSRLYANYDDAAHSWDVAIFREYIGILDPGITYLINTIYPEPNEQTGRVRHGELIKEYNETTREFENASDSVIIENVDNKELLSGSVRTMLSTGEFTMGGGNQLRFPSALGSFDWSKLATIEELLPL